MTVQNTALHASLLGTYGAALVGWLHDPTHLLLIPPALYYLVATWRLFRDKAD